MTSNNQKSKCDICGKTILNLINHDKKHVCGECYTDIFEKEKSNK